MLNIAVLPGDGIGVEVTEAAIPVFAALKIPVSLSFGDIGWSFWQQEGNPLPERTWQLIKQSDATLLGAITSKPVREAQLELQVKDQQNHRSYLSPLIQLRQNLDLFANIRPCFSLQKTSKHFRFCIIRENTEGLYAGFDFHPLPEALHSLIKTSPHWQLAKESMSCALRLQSQGGLKRIFEFAFQYAKKEKLPLVTLADKPNVLRQSGAFARDIFEEVAKDYPDINAEIVNVDSVALHIVTRPERFGVIVAENMFADILSDVAAGIMGGLGFAPSANLGEHHCYFEPVHGSGLRLKPGQANPSAMFLTISMLLDYLGYVKEAITIRKSVMAVVQENRRVTYDLGGDSSTQDMAKDIIERCIRVSE